MISAGIGFVLTTALLGFIGWQAFRAPSTLPPDIEVQVEGIAPGSGGWIVQIRATNRSPTTAAAVQVEGHLEQNGQVIATSEVTFDYVPGYSEQQGGLFFKQDPASLQLTFQAHGYSKP